MNDRNVRRLRSILLGLAIGVGATLIYVAAMVWWPERGPVFEVLGAAPGFELIDQQGEPFTHSDLRGKVWVANFIFTNCPGPCPLLSARMASLQRSLANQGLLGDVQLVSFSIDPEYDTPDVLREYARTFGADPAAWHFLTGPLAEIERVVGEGFYLGMQKAPWPEGTAPTGHPYDVLHSNRFVVVDRTGWIRGYFDGLDLDVEVFAAALRHLVNEKR